MKNFDKFLTEYSQNEAFRNRMAGAAGDLSGEQFSAVSKVILIVLREYHEWSQE